MMCKQTTTSLIFCYWWGVSFVTLPSILLFCLVLPAVHSFSPSIIVVPHSQSITTRTTTSFVVVPSIILHESNSVYGSRTSIHTSKSRTSRSVSLRQSQGDDSNNDDDDDADEEEKQNLVNNEKKTGDENESKNDDDTEPTWIQQAMGTTESEISLTPTPDTVDNPPPLPTTTTMITQSGVAGFAVDSELGFVCLISHHDDANDVVDDDADDGQPPPQQQQFVPVVISHLDRTTVQSAEALCLIQLVGGLDLGAVVFPPDILARLVAAELEEEDNADDDESAGDNDTSAALVEDLRTRVTLLAVTVVRDNDDDDTDDDVGGKVENPTTTTTTTPATSSSPERTATINKVSTKVLTAVQKLHGLAEATAEQVVAAMEVHANADGILDRVAFSEVLETLRRRDSVGGSRNSTGHWKFRLTASINKGESDAPSTTSLVDFSATAFESIGLALRYKVKVRVSNNDCWRKEEGSGLTVFEGTSQVVARFPFFRPVQELKEDAKIMDGLIPSMFFKEKPPENQDKA